MIPAAAPMVRGMPGVLLVVALGVPLPLALLADGEWWEEELPGVKAVASEVVYDRFRFLDLSEQVLLAKPAKPELIAQLWESDPEKVKEALKQIEPINLRGRGLRGALFDLALLSGADLREAQLRGADLQSAGLYGVVVETSDTALVDLRSARWTPLQQGELIEIRKLLAETIAYTEGRPRKEALERIESAGRAGLDRPILESCLIDAEVPPALSCRQQWLPAEIAAFQSELFLALEKLACQSSWTARGLIRQIDPNVTSGGRFGLAGRFVALLDKPKCKGLSSLPEEDKDQIRTSATGEEEHRAQSRAGKPAEESLASPIPLSAIAPETP